MAQNNSSNYQIMNVATGGFTFPLNANFSTYWIKIQGMDRWSITIATDSGTAAGTVAIKVSDFGPGTGDRTKRIPARDEPTAAQASTLAATSASATLAASNTAYRVWDSPVTYTWLQLQFTDTSGGTNTGNATLAITEIVSHKS